MRIIILVLATVLLIGCGGRDATEAVLHLDSGTYTESEFHQKVRTELTDSAEDPKTQGFCDSLQGLSDDEAFMVIMGPSQFTLPSTDQQRVAAIYREECAKFLILYND